MTLVIVLAACVFAAFIFLLGWQARDHATAGRDRHQVARLRELNWELENQAWRQISEWERQKG